MADHDDIGPVSDGGSHRLHEPKPDLGVLVVPVTSNGHVQMVAPPRRFHWTLAALVGIVALGALLRVWNIDAVGFNGDETIYAGQGASIANAHGLAEFFPTFRAHPLLFQTLLAAGYDAGLGAPFERLFAAAFGLGSIVLTFGLGRLMWGRTVGLIAALLIAVMPYEVLVSRQVLLDAPMAFFGLLTLYSAARFSISRRL